MVENVKKAIKIDEHVSDSLTTSMVDDVFYVLQSCCRRAISTSKSKSVVTVLAGAANLLSNEYLEALQQKMREPNLGARLFLGGVGVQKTGTEIATALNNMDVSSEYIIKLRHEIEEQCTEVKSKLSVIYWLNHILQFCVTPILLAYASEIQSVRGSSTLFDSA